MRKEIENKNKQITPTKQQPNQRKKEKSKKKGEKPCHS